MLSSFKERITSFLFNFCFSLSRAFSIVDSLLLVQVKDRVFGVLQVFITRIKGYARVKVADKDSNTTINNNKNKEILLKLLEN